MLRTCSCALALMLLATPAARAQDVDYSQFVKAPGRVSVSPSARVGYTVTQSLRSGGIEQTNHYAVVGEDDETFRVEHVGPALAALSVTLPGLQGALMGLVVRKADGVVLEAFLGLPGEPLQPLEIAPASASESPEGEEGQVEIALGTFPCLTYEGEVVTSRVGTEGVLEGILLQREEGGASYELTAFPVEGEREVGGEALATRTLTYSNGQVLVLTDDPVVDAFFPSGVGGMLEMRMPDVQVVVSARGDDAQPRLRWDP